MTSPPSHTPLPPDFYHREKHDLARALLGRDLVRRVDGRLLRGRIVETEAYGGPDDPASHADTGVPTDRTRAMFGAPGTAYVYKIYGMYFCLNVVAPADEKAAAILIRAAAPLDGRHAMARRRGLEDRYESNAEAMPKRVEKNLLSGPGKLCQAMAVDCAFDGREFHERHDDGLWLAAGEPAEQMGRPIEQTPRIGLNPETVGEAAERPWRYILSDSEFLSR